jgi:hypothetical protein
MSSDSKPAPAALALGLNDDTLGLLGAAILLVSAVVWSAQSTRLEKTDFSLTYVGATIVHGGLGHRLYDVELQKQTRDFLFQNPNPLFFEHPPFEALLISPLAALPFRTAYLIWGILNATVWLLLIFFLRPFLAWPRENLGYVCLWLLFAPVAVALYQGQSSIILLSLFAISFTRLKRESELSAGITLGFGLIKFQFVLPFALIFLFRMRWRFLAGFLISTCILGALSIATVGVHGVVEYARFLLTIAGNPQNLSYGSAVDMPTIHGFLYAILGQRISHAGLNIASALLSILLLVWVARRWQLVKSEAASDLLFGAAIAASLLAGSHMFTHDFSPLILAMFIAGAHLQQGIPRRNIAIATTLALFWIFPIYFVFVAWHCLYLMCPVLLLFVYLEIRAAEYASRHGLAEVECVRA